MAQRRCDSMPFVRNAAPPEDCLSHAVKPMLNGNERSAQAMNMRADGSVTGAEFKTVMRQVVSSVAIVTSRAGRIRNGLTATAVCSVSAEPPTMLICVNRRASAERIIAESGVFAINFLTQDQHRIARLFSTSKLRAEERFAE